MCLFHCFIGILQTFCLSNVLHSSQRRTRGTGMIEICLVERSNQATVGRQRLEINQPQFRRSTNCARRKKLLKTLSVAQWDCSHLATGFLLKRPVRCKSAVEKTRPLTSNFSQAAGDTSNQVFASRSRTTSWLLLFCFPPNMWTVQQFITRGCGTGVHH